MSSFKAFLCYIKKKKLLMIITFNLEELLTMADSFAFYKERLPVVKI